MNGFLIYLAKVAVGSALLYAVFAIFYGKETFFRRNRIMLLLVMLLPAIIPLLNLSLTMPDGPSAYYEGSIYKVIASGDVINRSALSLFDLGFAAILFIIWAVMALFMLIRTITGIVKTMSIIRAGERIDGTNRVLTDNDFPPFSFWSFIVLPGKTFDNDDYNEIVAHEEAHIAQKHTLDLLLCELYIALFWFNPVAWLIRKSVVLNHEYLADSATLETTADIKYYQYSLLSMRPGLMYIPIAHNYNSNIKNRIIMMNKKSTRNYAAWKNLLILPAVMFLLAVFSFKSSPVRGELPGQQNIFSEDSKVELLRFVMTNIVYPQNAREAGTVGSIFVIVETGNNGKIKSVTAKNGSEDPGVPYVLDELVVVGYGDITDADGSNDLTLLKEEGIRTCKLIEGLDIPELKNGSMKFSIPIKFKLESK